MEQPSTVRKPGLFLTPASESRASERGLKKLAWEAFRFVKTSKRTAYKDVANKLIDDLGAGNEEEEFDFNEPEK